MFAALVNILTTILFYLLLLLFGLWIWFHWSHRELLRAAAKIPVTLPTIPILGHTHLFISSIEATCNNVLQMTVGAVSRGIRTICVWCGPIPIIILGDLDDLRLILNGTNVSDKADEYHYFVTGFDSGTGPFRSHLLSAQGQVWKISRKHLNPLLHPQNLQSMIPAFNINSRELVARMQNHVGKGAFNVMEYTMDISLKTVCNLIFGPDIDIDIKSESFKGLMKVVEGVPELFIKRVLHPWLRIRWLFQLVHRTRVKQLNAYVKDFTDPILKLAEEKRTQKLNNRKINEKNDGTNENQEFINMLDAYTVLRERYPDFTETDMRCEMFSLYCTGTDTVGSGTASCFLALAQYQDIQERLYKEVISVVGEDDVILEDLARMPYLDQVVKETLRTFLTVPFTMRKLSKDVKLSDCSIPAGTSVVCNLAAIHMNPEIYPNPNEFDPERFSPENSGREKFTFIPFSGGPRICIGKTYAMQLMKIQIIHVLRNFKLTTNQDIHNIKKKLIVTLVSTEGYNIFVEKRKTEENFLGKD